MLSLQSYTKKPYLGKVVSNARDMEVILNVQQEFLDYKLLHHIHLLDCFKRDLIHDIASRIYHVYIRPVSKPLFGSGLSSEKLM
jgi:hypothetical protein